MCPILSTFQFVSFQFQASSTLAQDSRWSQLLCGSGRSGSSALSQRGGSNERMVSGSALWFTFCIRWWVGCVIPRDVSVFLEGQAELLGSQTVLLVRLCVCSFKALT